MKGKAKRDNQGKFLKGNKINLGRFHSDKTKQKIRETNKRKGIKPIQPKVRTKKHRENLGKALKGKLAGDKNPSKRLEVREKLRESKLGNQNPNWKGGITELSRVIRSSFENRLWIKYCMERDDFTCKYCKIIGGLLEVHHMKALSKIIKENNIKTMEDARKCAELWELDNGFTLCKDCHIKIDKVRSKFK